jgi:DNA-binding transcriptional ArsR family regulator
MSESKADLLLHPVRMRIIVEISGGTRTASQLAAVMPDVPQATLYRHLNALAEGGVLHVVAENPVRGTVERVYAVAGASLSPDDLSRLDREEMLQRFTLVISTFIADFQRYLESSTAEHPDVMGDGLEFSKVALELSDDELAQLNRKLWSILEASLHNEPSPDRKRRLVSYLILPTP